LKFLPSCNATAKSSKSTTALSFHHAKWPIVVARIWRLLFSYYRIQWIGEKDSYDFIRDPSVLWQVIKHPPSSNVTKTTKDKQR
jgi:hypothetical protein